MTRRRRLTDDARLRTFMRLLRLENLMPSYTNAGPRGFAVMTAV